MAPKEVCGNPNRVANTEESPSKRRRFTLPHKASRIAARRVFAKEFPQFFIPGKNLPPPKQDEAQEVSDMINLELARINSPDRCTAKYVIQTAHNQRFRMKGIETIPPKETATDPKPVQLSVATPVATRVAVDWTDTEAMWDVDTGYSPEWATAVGLGPPLD